jgi:hypothetical protein
VGFEPTLSAGEQLQTYALDRAANGTGISRTLHLQITFFVKRQKNTTRNNRTYLSYTRFDPGTFKQEKRYLNLASRSLIIEVN